MRKWILSHIFDLLFRYIMELAGDLSLLSKYTFGCYSSDKSTTPTHYSRINGIYCVCFGDLWYNIVSIGVTKINLERIILLNRFTSRQVTQYSSLISNNIHGIYVYINLLVCILYTFVSIIYSLLLLLKHCPQAWKKGLISEKKRIFQIKHTIIVNGSAINA